MSRLPCQVFQGVRICAVQLLVVCAGWIQTSSISAQEPHLPPAQEILVPTKAYARDQDVLAQTRRLIQAHDTAGLEALADDLRKNRERLDGGTWILSSFYNEADTLPDEEPAAGRAMEFFERWARERPNNITAQVCLIRALTSYAWTARGSGWADSVTEEGWKLFRERLARANEILERSKNLEEKCPGLPEAAQIVALGQGWSHEKYMNMVSEAIQAEPTYGRYYTNACYWLLPRWYGKKGEFETWIAQVAEESPAADRDRQYAFLVWMADRMSMNGEIVFAPGRLDWERTKRGFHLWLKESPDNLMVRFQLLRLALLANDRATVREQLKLTGNQYFPHMWTNRNQFEQARLFAFGSRSNPLLGGTKSRPAPMFQPEVIARVKTITKAVGGFIGGALAGVCLLLLCVPFQQIRTGVVAMLACMLLGTLFGTLAALLPATLLLIDLRRKLATQPPEPEPPSGWIVLLWVVVLGASNIALQFGASILMSIPLILERGISSGSDVMRLATTDGTVLTIVLNALWITLLGLLVICRPRFRNAWKNRLALHPCPLLPGILWSCAALVVLLGLGAILDHFMDARSKEALRLISLGLNSPVSYYVALALAAPIFEELLFRGYAYTGWIDKLGFWGTAAASSLFLPFATSNMA